MPPPPEPNGEEKSKSRKTQDKTNEARSKKNKSTNALESVPENVIEKKTVVYRLAAGELFPDKINHKKQIYKDIPNPSKGDALVAGDVIKAINDKEVTTRKVWTEEVRKLAKKNATTDYDITITYLRLIGKVPIGSGSEFIPAAHDIPAGFSYLIAHMIMFTKARLGIEIKGYNGKVYITSVDNGENSVGKRVLRVGDAILAVGKTSVANRQTCREALNEAFENKYYAWVVIERAEQDTAAALVRQALAFNKKNEPDMRLADDNLEICAKELLAMKERAKSQKMPRSIERDPKASKRRRRHDLKFSEKLKVEKPIEMDQTINPILLRHCPPLPGFGVNDSATNSNSTSNSTSSTSKKKKEPKGKSGKSPNSAASTSIQGKAKAASRKKR
ncbi:unnamed protein product, partial [Mesorhabditis spiculigera]